MAWPHYLDLKRDTLYTLETRFDSVEIELLSVETITAPECWQRDLDAASFVAGIRIGIRIGELTTTLEHTPFKRPDRVGDWQVMVETVAANGFALRSAPVLPRGVDARIAIQHNDLPWGPTDLVFPVRNYRWRANSNYQNTWGALVPYQKNLYYHRGEDFGGAPDQLGLQAIQAGEVIETPLPDGDGRSNTLLLQVDDRAIWAYAHMNTGSLLPNANLGSRLKQGEIFGKLGSTYQGREDLIADPHLHLDLTVGGKRVNCFPMVVQAYLDTFDDPLLPIAGVYRAARVGETIELDGTASIAQPGHKIVSWQWRLSDGRTVDAAKARIGYPEPGLYSEELIICDDTGNQDRDYVQIRVWKDDSQKPMPLWIETHPGRGLHPGVPVNIQIRHYELPHPVTIDFGDDSPHAVTHGEAVQHPYGEPGTYTITASTTGPKGEPMKSRLRVVVENPAHES